MALCVNLNHFSVLRFSGDDAEKFLQGQITSDITQLNDSNVQFSCQCDSKGKTLSTFYLIRHAEDILLIGHSASLSLSLVAFKKFAVFSKVTITDVSDEFVLYGLDAEALANSGIADCELDTMAKTTQSENLLFRIQDKNPRFILMQPTSTATSETQGALVEWQQADVAAGIAHLTQHASSEFIPQMLNLQALDAICFTKGCYMGQETVARAKYLGKNKRAGYIVTGTTAVSPEETDVVEMQLGENWRRAGAIASFVWDEQNQQCILFAVLPNDIDPEAVLRLKSQPEHLLSIQALPYSLEEAS